jgi:hypothetical protein
MAVCPNISHPDWKTLEARYGEKGAWRKYIENGYKIPTPENVSKQLKFDKDGIRLKKRDTLQALNDNPSLAKKIIDRLARLYPYVKVYKNGLFDKNGNWIDIAPGEKGMHYRNAFMGAVAWANDAYMETPPHEYAHEYVDMFRELPIVKKGIAKYGEEQLVKRIGAYYAKREMSNSFQKFLQDFWSTIKSFLGSPDVADILAQNFYEGKMLDGPIHKGTAIVRYQEGDGVLKKTNGGVNSDGRYDKDAEKIVELTDDWAKNEIKGNGVGTWYESTEGVEEFDRYGLSNYISQTFNKLKSQDLNRDGKYMNSPFLDKRLIDDVLKTIADKDSMDLIGQAIIGKEEVVLDTEQAAALATILRAEKRLNHIQKANNSYYDGDGNFIPREDVTQNIKDSIDETAKRREYLYNKVPTKALRESLKFIEKALTSLQLNARLIAKYLSGSENSELSDMAYKALDQADSKKLGIMQRFTDIFTAAENIPGYNKWSIFQTPDANIKDLDTVSVETSDGTVELTKAEYITMYLNLRQADSRKAIINKGFILDQSLKGRESQFNKTFTLKSSEPIKIQKAVEADSEMMEVIKKIDESLAYMYEETNPVFKQEHGYDLEEREYYFPVFTGEQSVMQIRSKNSLDQFRAGNARLGQDKPLRIGDSVAIMNNIKNSGATYAAYALPISNLRKLMADIADKYENQQEKTYFKSLEGIINSIESPGELFNSGTEKNFNQWVNSLTSNFSVSVLAMNLAVMMKQPVSYITAMEEIDKKYLKAAGWGVGGVVGISPMKIIRSLAYTGVKGGETKLPVEWNLDKSDPIYEELMKMPKMRARLEGMVSKETGEALMNQDIGRDKIKVPGMKNEDGTPVYISKARLMEGIKIFDSVTIMSIYKAVKLETAEQHPDLVEGTSEYETHVELRLNDIVNKTQPTYDASNRAVLSLSKNPVARVLTMFSSARSKVAMLMIDGVISYVNNPSPENKAKLFKRSLNVMVTTSIALAAIDMLKGATLYGMDDDEDIFAGIGTLMIANNLSYLYGINNLSSLVMSQLDDKPWHKSMQHPVEGLVQETSEALAHIFKGNLDKAFWKSLDVAMKTTGLPLVAKTYPKAVISRLPE